MTPEDKQLLHEIHSALIGNEDLGHKGLVKRVEETENWIAEQKRIHNKIAGALFVIFALSSALAFLIHAGLRKLGWI